LARGGSREVFSRPNAPYPQRYGGRVPSLGAGGAFSPHFVYVEAREPRKEEKISRGRGQERRETEKSRRGPQGGEAPLSESGRTLRGALRGGGPNGDGGSRAGMGGSFRSLVLFLRFDCSASSSVLSAPSFFCTSERRDAGNCRREAIDGLLEAPFGCPGGRLAKLGIRKARSFALDSPRISFRLLSPWTFPLVLGLLFRPPFLVLPRF